MCVDGCSIVWIEVSCYVVIIGVEIGGLCEWVEEIYFDVVVVVVCYDCIVCGLDFDEIVDGG